MSYKFGNKVKISAHKSLNKDIWKELWQNFCCGGSQIEIKETEDFVIEIGNPTKVNCDGNLFTMNISSEGICITAENERGTYTVGEDGNVRNEIRGLCS